MPLFPRNALISYPPPSTMNIPCGDTCTCPSCMEEYLCDLDRNAGRSHTEYLHMRALAKSNKEKRELESRKPPPRTAEETKRLRLEYKTNLTKSQATSAALSDVASGLVRTMDHYFAPTKNNSTGSTDKKCQVSTSQKRKRRYNRGK